jgi:hypothetical protein
MTEDLANEDLFDAAVRPLGGRRVFEVFGKPPTGQTADWVFLDRRLIIEHKHVDAAYAETPKFRAGLAALQAVLAASPKTVADRQDFAKGVRPKARRECDPHPKIVDQGLEKGDDLRVQVSRRLIRNIQDPAAGWSDVLNPAPRRKDIAFSPTPSGVDPESRGDLAGIKIVAEETNPARRANNCSRRGFASPRPGRLPNHRHRFPI